MAAATRQGRRRGIMAGQRDGECEVSVSVMAVAESARNLGGHEI
jgi:hypothetical protein